MPLSGTTQKGPAQTRQLEGLVPLGACGFKSRLRHQSVGGFPHTRDHQIPSSEVRARRYSSPAGTVPLCTDVPEAQGTGAIL